MTSGDFVFRGLFVSFLAWERIERAGASINELRSRFRELIRQFASRDKQDEWDKLLLPQPTSPTPPPVPSGEKSPQAKDVVHQVDSPYTPGPAGFTREFTSLGGKQEVPDHLGVEGLAHRLAELIALRETRLPLAVGLFGNWGSGKSHFMNLMDRHLKKRATETPADWAREANEPGAPARPDPTGDGPWCRKIVPIYFNAWHYLDANLWASLVTKIFEELFLYLSPQTDELAQVQKHLLEAGGATARAEVEVSLAQAAATKARMELETAQAESAKARSAVEGMLDNLLGLLPDLKRSEERKKVADLFGVSAETATLEEVAAKRQEIASLPGQVADVWRRIFDPNSSYFWYRLGWLVAALVISPLIFYVGGLPVVKGWLGDITRGVQWIMGLAAFAGTFLLPCVVEVRRRLAEMNSLISQAEQARAEKVNTPEVQSAQATLTESEQSVASAQERLAAARMREQQLKKEEAELAPARRIARFIETRAQSTDYRGQLGLVSLARKDFQELSDLFADADALEEKKKNAESEDERKKLDELSKSIDRIVLFVDDLDRCQPEKVVEVLQAVHLLLAFPLFAVVVGVDQRCLRQSLRMQFKGLLTPDHESENGQKHVSPLAIEDQERPATPLDYLEKIFHVPFHLPPMEKAGYQTLIEKLTKPPATASSAQLSQTPLLTPSATPTEPVQPADLRQFNLTTQLGNLPGATPLAPPSEESTAETIPPTMPAPPPQVIGSVPLLEWEWRALMDYHSLIRTPRGATRLLNTYRLVRAGIAQQDWATFCDPREHRVMMLLLASAAGFPADARDWFSRLRQEEINGSTVDAKADPAWAQFKSVYEETFQGVSPRPDKSAFVRWLPLVEQFAF